MHSILRYMRTPGAHGRTTPYGETRGIQQLGCKFLRALTNHRRREACNVDNVLVLLSAEKLERLLAFESIGAEFLQCQGLANRQRARPPRRQIDLGFNGRRTAAWQREPR